MVALEAAGDPRGEVLNFRAHSSAEEVRGKKLEGLKGEASSPSEDGSWRTHSNRTKEAIRTTSSGS